MPRYTLNDRGILALSTGIVDPGYEGLVSSTLINFSEEDFGLSRGQPFLRVTFHKIEPLQDDEWREQIRARQSSYNRIPSPDYVVKRKQMAKKLPETFLNIPLTAKNVAEKVAEARFQSASELLSKGATAVALIALIVAILIFLLTPITSELTTSSISDRVSARIANDEIEPIEEEILELRKDVNKLQNR
jgi:hypothetical protein